MGGCFGVYIAVPMRPSCPIRGLVNKTFQVQRKS